MYIKPLKSRKAQLSVEALAIMMLILTLIAVFWYNGPPNRATEKSKDTNGVLLAIEALDEMASAIEHAGMSGEGVKKDFTVHIPFNTVDISYDKPDNKLTMSVLLYHDVDIDPSLGSVENYTVDISGKPIDPLDPRAQDTDFYVITLSKEVDFPIGYLGFCRITHPANEIRGELTQLRFIDTVQSRIGFIQFCCEAGYNINAYTDKTPNEDNKHIVNVKGRHYYSAKREWKMAG
jgi:hypothetical protein